jgi:arylsulfatase A
MLTKCPGEQIAVPSRDMSLITLLLAALATSISGVDSPAPTAPPNVVIIYVDDMGWADVECYGGTHVKTPHLNQMAADGRMFSDFYVAQPVCSASRIAMLTGCYPNRVGIAGALGPWSRNGIHDDETTIAEMLKAKGYATAAFGKWHLGFQEQFLPTNHGFDEYSGIPYSNDMWPLHPDLMKLNEATRKRRAGYPNLVVYEDTKIVDPVVTPDDQQSFTTDFTERAVDFIDRHANEPFFVYLAHPMPHVPLYVGSDRDGATGLGIYADVIGEIDWSVGQVMDTLQRHDLTDNTLVIFASDNGPWLSYGDHAGQTGGLREGKGTTWEGGVRVPCIMQWPGVIPAETVCGDPMMTIDLLPTIAEFTGGDLPASKIDGRSAAGIVRGDVDATSPQEAYFFYYHNNHLEAMRSGSWKLHFPHQYRTMNGRPPGRNGLPKPYQQAMTGLELYDLRDDPNETTDVAGENPDVVASLMAMADAMRSELGDALTNVKGTANREPGRIDTP